MAVAELKVPNAANPGAPEPDTPDTLEFGAVQETYLHMVIRRFLKHKLAVAGVLVVLLLIVCALFAPAIAPHDPNAITNNFNAAPSAEYPLGTDRVSRDVLSRLIFGTRVSLTVGFLTVAISVVIGTVLGLISGYFGKAIDMLIMRICDIFMSFPQLMLILVVVSIVGPNTRNITLVLGLLGWPQVTRLVRGNVLSVKQSDYMKACTALGYHVPRKLFKHILPNTLAPILVNATFGIAGNILMEAGLSFLGLGVQPPTASWGNMLTDAQSLTILTSQPWLWVPPGVMIMLSVLAVNFVGDGLRDAIDPKSMS
ncbi:oligopeptide ABC transporter permease [Caproicibacter sp.]|uniref:oligopeptide ABC transporter permease n=1 Tax=Caproicibacter sp. TaxID=2814884 RepID=UPI003989E769